MNYLINYKDCVDREVEGLRMVEANSEEEAIRKFIINVIQTDPNFYDYVYDFIFNGEMRISITDYKDIKQVK